MRARPDAPVEDDPGSRAGPERPWIPDVAWSRGIGEPCADVGHPRVESPMIDGAGPFRVLRSVIVPQAIPAIVAVSLFHFFFAWNDFFVPYLYLASKPELQPLSIAIQQYNALYASQPTLIQASALMTMAVPIVVFLLAQRAFMRGVVVTGVEK